MLFYIINTVLYIGFYREYSYFILFEFTGIDTTTAVQTAGEIILLL